MSPKIKELAANLNLANANYRKTITRAKPFGDMQLYRVALKAYREFWQAVDSEGIKTEDAVKLLGN